MWNIPVSSKYLALISNRYMCLNQLFRQTIYCW